MSTLTLVRHGQAMPFEGDPDRLSPKGESQSRMLGAYWGRREVIFDEVYTGSLLRQRRTAEIVGESYAQAGLPWPAQQVIEGFNEYDAIGIMSVLVPKLAEQDKQFGKLVATHKGMERRPESKRYSQKVFEAVMVQWHQGKIEAPGIESWLAFRARVQQAIRHIIQDGSSGRRVVVFTSGGPIGVTVQLALAAPDRTALELNWRVRNSSLTEFLFSGDRFSLDTFNTVPHLEDPSLWTFR